MRRVMIRSALLLVLTAAIACVEARDPPAIPAQAQIAYGPKVFLVDATDKMTPRDDLCTRLGAVVQTTTTATASVMPSDDLRDAEGNVRPINPRVAHNCYINVKPKSLRVDVVEVTNELFQLCVDSGWCSSPDPSKASKSQACTSEDDFDRCPVGDMTHGQAKRFCEFIGRRLPTGVEHVIMRQAGAMDTQDPAKIPVLPNGTAVETDPPATCPMAVIGSSGCNRPQPVRIGSKPEDTKGAAEFDVVNGNPGQVFDLMGNLAEWSSDLLPPFRGLATGMPWFCQAPIPPRASMSEEPACPTGATCVMGQYQPEGLPMKDYPVCIAFPGFTSISGAHGGLFGGSFGDSKNTRYQIGVFARRAETSPDDKAVKEYGFRCTGDVGVDDAVEAQ
jgi:formylglycine-generating enzyme required for sulfatase activity